MILDELINSNQKEIQVIIFRLGNEEYATPIANVQEVIIPQAYTRIPESPHYVEGVINLRGNIIPVIDGRKKFYLDNHDIDQISTEVRIMIMDTDDGTVGLVVDNVSDVILLDVANIEPPPVNLGENNEIFWGIGTYTDKLLILINCQKGLSFNNDKHLKEFQSITDIVKKTKIND